jgi:hypothetical protein
MRRYARYSWSVGRSPEAVGKGNEWLVLRLLVVMTCRPRVTPAVLVVPVLIEAHHGRLRGDAAVFKPGSLDRSNEVFSPLKIGRLEHDLVVGDVEMAVQKCDTEAVETLVFRKHNSDLLQALGIAVIDRPDISNVVELVPLHRLENHCTHPQCTLSHPPKNIPTLACSGSAPRAKMILTDSRGAVYLA